MTSLRSIRGWLTGYGLLGAVAYATLLPLWEGYDEPFHYAYVQHLDLTSEFPVLDQTPVRQEIWYSMILAPASGVNARASGLYTSYSRYFELSGEERSRRREALRVIPPLWEGAPSRGNYEAQQAPLAYLMLAPLHHAVSQWPLYPRIWMLRIVAGAASVLLFLYALYALGREMGISAGYRHAAVFCVLSAQSLYGAIAHVANDWLSLPLIPILFLAAGRFWRDPGRWRAILLAAALAAGLLAKSYFLVFVPFVFAIVLWHNWRNVWIPAGIVMVAAGPWYARNLHLYGSLTGLQAAVRAVPRSAVWDTALSTSWPAALAGMARGGLWSGNNSFTTFSAATLNLILLLLAAGCVLWIRAGQRSPQHWTVITGTVLFSAIPIYAMLLFGTMYGQVHPGANSWYTVSLVPGAALIAFAGFSSKPRAGSWFARALIVLSAYVLAATYFAKLIPLYAGFDQPARLQFLLALYRDGYKELIERLDQTAMAGGGVVISLAITVVVFSVLLGWRLWRQVAPASPLK